MPSYYDRLVSDELERKRARAALAAKIAVNYPVTADYVDWCLTVADGDVVKVRQALDFTCLNGWAPTYAVSILCMAKQARPEVTPAPPAAIPSKLAPSWWSDAARLADPARLWTARLLRRK